MSVKIHHYEFYSYVFLVNSLHKKVVFVVDEEWIGSKFAELIFKLVHEIYYL